MQTKFPAGVRIATAADAQKLFDLFMLAAEENAMAPVCEAKVIEAIDMAITRKGAVIGVIDGDNGDIAGAVGLVMSPLWYTTQWHVEEMLNFVHPSYRMAWRGDAGKLIDFAKWWADQLGLKLLMGVLTHTRTEGKVRLYRRKLPYKGALFLYEGGAAA